MGGWWLLTVWGPHGAVMHLGSCGCPHGELWLCVCCVFPRSAWEGGVVRLGQQKPWVFWRKLQRLLLCSLVPSTRAHSLEIHLQQFIGRNVLFIRSHTYPCELPLA